MLVDGLDRLLTPFKPSAASYAADTLEGRGVELRLGRMVKAVTTTGVALDDDTIIPAQTVVWAGGVRVEGTVASRLGAPPGGTAVCWSTPTSRSPVIGMPTPSATPPPCPGDRTEPDRICPQLAQVAIQSGAHAANQVLNRAEGRPTSRSATTTRASWPPSGGGRPSPSSPGGDHPRDVGWLAWLGLHIVYLIGFRNRIVVLVNWSWRYLSWRSGPRVIVGDKLERSDEGTSSTGCNRRPPPGGPPPSAGYGDPGG